mmetsp:Transcript_18664/g.56364  ORF Transcript_18664/g.56364 Transcript_18664/m.56364 type:complete len:123 (+) Transcript_18664:420-788(+)
MRDPNSPNRLASVELLLLPRPPTTPNHRLRTGLLEVQSGAVDLGGGVASGKPSSGEAGLAGGLSEDEPAPAEGRRVSKLRSGPLDSDGEREGLSDDAACPPPLIRDLPFEVLQLLLPSDDEV